MSKYFPPQYGKTHFHCPFCEVNSNQIWHSTYYYTHTYQMLSELELAICSHCKEMSLWLERIMIFPDKSLAPLPHDDLPEELLVDYLEASSIVNHSPRGAAALLRLVLQKLMFHLGESGKDINKDIGSLVQKGLDPHVQQALDIVRVIGNESVHPGQLDLKDDFETTNHLFKLINFIVEDRITRPKTIEALFNKLPEDKRNGIVARDNVKTPK
ncbi:DUF4145 domain-containing protein [Lysinibacillus sp. K60]|uniref:DUF4145 domain-containing protein n=1 Tax=Lysinibacillus sp. K60 TaxID=2720027 RepID=UPI001C8C3C0C|nr:DUF4145 domain-containing protein [Lysinibacillus sp. K60]MBX8945621.1 DUF4145 domain-containing protein [Lysinibacillus sp. K60]